MSRIAAGTEPPSWSRGERRWGLGRGKCVMPVPTMSPKNDECEITEAARDNSEVLETRASKVNQRNGIRVIG